MADVMSELSTIAETAQSVRASESDGLLRLASLGDDLRRIMRGSSRAAVEDLLSSAVAALEPSRVIPISSEVANLLECLPTERWSGGPVVLVDGLAASGTSIRVAARRVGSETCKAVVLAAAADADKALGPVELVVALDQVPGSERRRGRVDEVGLD